MQLGMYYVMREVEGSLGPVTVGQEKGLEVEELSPVEIVVALPSHGFPYQFPFVLL
ncbi:hypothetical protein [Algivirga pacifica]|uniref:Uncharacterized protein n=1 Tax=Algivirga pacifica TaxID=1162670 RepID=A0ABP9DL70_9BACT